MIIFFSLWDPHAMPRCQIQKSSYTKPYLWQVSRTERLPFSSIWFHPSIIKQFILFSGGPLYCLYLKQTKIFAEIEGTQKLYAEQNDININ